MRKTADSPAPAGRRRAALAEPSGSARSFLLTLLGEFVLPKGQPVWTSTFVAVMTGVGVGEKAARQAIARAASAGWIEGQRDGRRVSWTLTEAGRRLIENGRRRVSALSNADESWDGRWLIFVTSLPAARRSERAKLYRALQWSGFGNPSPGLWITPHASRVDEARRIIRDFELDGFTHAFVGTALDIGVRERQLVSQAWDLDQIGAHYAALLTRFSGRSRPRGAAVLFDHVQLVNARQRLPFIDPALPAELSPPRWRGRASAQQLVALRDRWRTAAHARWDALAAIDPSR